MSNWSTLDFGKYIGKSLPQVLFTDPDWFFWAYENGVLARRGLELQAQVLFKRATRIRVRRDGSTPLVVEYTQRGEVLQGVEVVPRGFEYHGLAERLPWFDLSYAKTLRSGMDKTGTRLILRALKENWFGSASTRMTKKVCEDFFSDETHFAAI